MDITYKGIKYFVERNEMENDSSLFNRTMFVVKQQPRTDQEYDKNIKYSNIWVNKTFLGCQYSEKIENIISNKEKNL